MRIKLQGCALGRRGGGATKKFGRGKKPGAGGFGSCRDGKNAMGRARVARSQGGGPRGDGLGGGGGIPATMCGGSRGAGGAHSPSGKGALGARPGKSNPPREEAGAVGRAAVGSSPGASAIWVRTRRAAGPDVGTRGLRAAVRPPLRSRPPGRRSPVPGLRRQRGPRGELRCVRRWAVGGSAGGGRTRRGCGGLRRHFRRPPRHFRVSRGSPPPTPRGASFRRPTRRCVLPVAEPAGGGFPVPEQSCRAGVWKRRSWNSPVFARGPPVVGAWGAGGVLSRPGRSPKTGEVAAGDTVASVASAPGSYLSASLRHVCHVLP